MVEKDGGKTSLEFLKMYEPVVLDDIEKLLSSKVNIVEALMRQYDILHYLEHHQNHLLHNTDLKQMSGKTKKSTASKTPLQ